MSVSQTKVRKKEEEACLPNSTIGQNITDINLSRHKLSKIEQAKEWTLNMTRMIGPKPKYKIY